MTRESDTTNPFINRLWVETKRVQVIFGLTRLTRLINRLDSCPPKNSLQNKEKTERQNWTLFLDKNAPFFTLYFSSSGRCFFYSFFFTSSRWTLLLLLLFFLLPLAGRCIVYFFLSFFLFLFLFNWTGLSRAHILFFSFSFAFFCSFFFLDVIFFF